MARFVFWNMARNPQTWLASVVVHQNLADVFLTAEFGGESQELLKQISTPGRSFSFHPSEKTEGLGLFACRSSCQVRRLADLDRVCVYDIQSSTGGQPILLFLVHLPSKLHQSVDDQTAISEVLATDIRQFEQMKGHDRTMVVGDFNMSPFENGMVGARELHGVSSEYVAMQGARVVRGESYPFFFNPTWSLIASRRNHAPGTHFYSRSSYFEHFWHTFDQVLVRPSLRSAFNLDSLRIVTSAGTATLLDSQGKPDKIGASDHLPILFDMDL